MSYELNFIDLQASTAGTQRRLAVHRFGVRGARPKVYVQAALHANEVPTIVTAHHLIALLAEADRRGEIVGEVVVVPAANPIGLGETVLGIHMGRHALSSGANFNRGFPDLAAAVASRVEPGLTQDPGHNTALIRGAMLAALAERTPRNELESLRLNLLSLACDADFVFDMHTEEAAIFAAVLAPWTVDHAALLVGDLAPELTFYADYPQLFDTVCSRPWADLAKRFPHAPIPQACLSATLELRGCADVDDAVSGADAARLVTFLKRVECVAGAPGPLPALRTQPTRFEGVEFVRSSVPGVVVYKCKLGDTIRKGQVIAEVVQPYATDLKQLRVPILSGTDGILFGKRHTAIVQADDVVGKVAGAEPLADPKHY